MSRDSQKRSLLGRVLSSIQFLVSPNINTDDRRAVPRIRCRYPISFLVETGTKFDGQLLDVSSGGLRIQTTAVLKLGLTLAINSPQAEDLSKLPPLMARVIWSSLGRNNRVIYGLSLPAEAEDEQTWLNEVLESLGYSCDGSQRRQHIRADGEIDGILRLEADDTEAEHAVSVLNLGMGGALLRCPEALEKNRQFHLRLGPFGDLPELELRGTILRVVPRPEQKTLYPSRFRPLDEGDDKLLREYILTLLGKDD